jgi:hypothetical protein
VLEDFLSPPPFDHQRYLRETIEFDQRGYDHLSSAEQNTYALDKVYLGDYYSARQLWEATEARTPGVYYVASNLGTACELTGDDATALKWIKEGIRRNPQSHEGTEWLHVKILEAKLALARDPQWLATHTVLGVDFGQAARPQAPRTLLNGNLGRPLSTEEVIAGLTYQLKERCKFVRTTDPVVASLLGDLGSLLLLQHNPGGAEVALRRARDYGLDGRLYSDRLELAYQELDRQRTQEREAAELRRATVSRLPLVALGAGAVAVGLGVALVASRSRRRRGNLK